MDGFSRCKRRQGLKPNIRIRIWSARLKSCPDTKEEKTLHKLIVQLEAQRAGSLPLLTVVEEPAPSAAEGTLPVR